MKLLPQLAPATLSPTRTQVPEASDAGAPLPPDDDKPRQKWWVYAGIVGAVAIAGGLVLANDLANDRQRIELRW